jgi:type II secretory ATPase GspE/PulE/Tfp pilus assembly ATPase PilB-like protein
MNETVKDNVLNHNQEKVSLNEKEAAPLQEENVIQERNTQDSLNVSLQKKTRSGVGVNVIKYFEDGVELVTAPDGALNIKEDTRNLLALFSNGRFLVCDTHKFDGRVLSFEVLARRKRMQVSRPEYVPMSIIQAVYEFAKRKQTVKETKDGPDLLQMQKDLFSIVSRAAMQKVSDIHVIVAGTTQVMFRLNGLMQIDVEYSNEWGKLLFVQCLLLQIFLILTMLKMNIRRLKNQGKLLLEVQTGG